MSVTVEHVKDANFNDVVKNSDVPVLVDFWAPWCAPCRMVGPVLEEIAKEYDGKAKVVKVNVDEEQMTAAQFGIRSIPTISLFKNGEVAQTVVGAQPKAAFKQVLDANL